LPDFFGRDFNFRIETVIFPLRARVGMADFDWERGAGRNDYIFEQATVLSYNLVHPGAGVIYIRLIG